MYFDIWTNICLPSCTICLFVCHTQRQISVRKIGWELLFGMGWSHNRGAQKTRGHAKNIFTKKSLLPQFRHLKFSDYCNLYMRTISKLENTTRHPPPRDCWALRRTRRRETQHGRKSKDIFRRGSGARILDTLQLIELIVQSRSSMGSYNSQM